MATAKTAGLEELTKLATEFVTKQRGLWDHVAWTDFLSNVRTKGYDISGDMQGQLGELVEAMKRFYVAAASTESIEKAMRTVVNDSVAFVKKHHGVWGHDEWEDFVKTVRGNTRSLSEGTTGYLGGVLESVKSFYKLSPVAVIKKQKSPAPVESAPAPNPALTPTKKAKAKPTVTKAPLAVKAAPPSPPKRQNEKDDLTVIGGIGPALAKKLNEAGITSYAQLAALTVADIENLEKNIIRFSGRIKRDDWVGQAKKLSKNQ